MAIKVEQVPEGVWVTQCRGHVYVGEGENRVLKHCRAVLTYTAEDLVVEWDRGVDYRMLTCPVCRNRQEE